MLNSLSKDIASGCSRLEFKLCIFKYKVRSSTKEDWIHNGKKTTSLTSGAGKIGQPLVKEWN